MYLTNNFDNCLYLLFNFIFVIFSSGEDIGTDKRSTRNSSSSGHGKNRQLGGGHRKKGGDGGGRGRRTSGG